MRCAGKQLEAFSEDVQWGKATVVLFLSDRELREVVLSKVGV